MAKKPVEKPFGPAVKALSGVVAALLAVTLVFAGLCVCLAPVTTRALTQATCLDETSPYTADELTSIALATRAYVAGAVPGGVLLEAQADALASAIDDGRVPADAVNITPDELRTVTPHRLGVAFNAGVSDQLVFDDAASTHIDDCKRVITGALPILIAIAGVGFLLLAVCGCLSGRRAVDVALLGAGAPVLAAFVLVGAWALVDFDGFFAVFHSLFFAEGTWSFPWDSLLICMFPEAFWYGMAALWFATTALLAGGCVAFGLAGMRARRK